MARKLIIIVGLVLLLVVASRIQNRGTAARPLPDMHRVEYIILGSTDEVSVTYRNEQGGSQQDDFRRAESFDTDPERIVYDMRPGEFAYLSVQNWADVGDVTCQIRVDYVLWKTSTSTGEYGIATCSGRVGEDTPGED